MRQPVWRDAFPAQAEAPPTVHAPCHALLTQVSAPLSCRAALQTFLPLLLLGAVFSIVFITTRNLLPPIVLHSLWNVFVIWNLLKAGG